MGSREQPGAGAEVESIDLVREKNFKTICGVIQKQFPRARAVLDVGSSTGLFLQTARDNGLSATGLEPAVHLAEETRRRGYDVINGFFPGAQELVDKKYDIIIFNDSFEHIPNLQELIQGIKDHLDKTHGIAIINLPSSGGLMFKTAFLLYKLGIHAPFDRLWQKGFASPHLHYFNVQNLKRLFERYGFVLKYTAPLRYYTIKGLWKRISCKSSFFVSLVSWVCMVMLYPLSMLQSDCFMACFTLRKNP
jgi:2-polyprenyl-3-methyl-5-hydroxy-6-metoxy-1,4-benzoquinol methylase